MYYTVRLYRTAGDGLLDGGLETTICNEKQLKKLVSGINKDEYSIVEIKAIEGSYTKDYKEFIDKNEKLNIGIVDD